LLLLCVFVYCVIISQRGWPFAYCWPFACWWCVLLTHSPWRAHTQPRITFLPHLVLRSKKTRNPHMKEFLSASSS
jgi:hypothetical protein